MQQHHGGPSAHAARSRQTFSVAMVLIALLATLLGGLPTSLLSSADATVPTPPAGSAVISVKVGGDRQADGSTKGLAGVTLGLYGPGTANTEPSATTATQGSAGARYNTAWSWTTCVSDADGDCNFVIPIRAGTISSTGVPQDTRFWVVGEGTPSGWYDNPEMRLGGFGATPEFTWDYRFRTDTQLRAGTTYSSTTAMPAALATLPDRGFMRNRVDSNTEGGQGANVGRSTGVWSQSRTNPALAAKCGLNVAIVTDTSGSLGDAGIAQEKAAMDTFVDGFRGTPTQMSVFSFSASSPGNGATNAPGLLPVTTAAQASTFKNQYAGWLSGGGTSWDRGLAAAANSGNHYDLVVLLTDGNPTVYETPGATASAFNSFQDVDAGIFSANQLKAAGSRVVALGAGSALTAASELNLRAISGETEGSDYFRTADFAEAATILADLAKANCQGAIQVQKMIVPTGGTIAQATPAPAGWQFNASTSAPGVTVAAPTSATTTTGGNGIVDFGLSFTSPTTSGAVQVLETQQSGYEVVPVGSGAAARNAVCTDEETGDPVAVTDAGTTATPGFSVDGQVNAQVNCIIYNTKPPAPSDLVVTKSADPVSTTPVVAGQVVTYTLTFANGGGSAADVDYTDHLAKVLDDADLVAGSLTAGNGLTATLAGDGQSFRVTGSVAAGQTRTVTYQVKVKDAGYGDGQLDNFVRETGTNPPASCVPSDTLCTTHPIPGNLSVVKDSDPASGTEVSLGDLVSYTLTFTNTGGKASPVDYTDDLTKALDDATVEGQPTISGNAHGLSASSVSGGKFTVTGDLEAESTVQVKYSLRVKTSNLGDGSLDNFVVKTGDNPPSTCEDTNDLCTEHPVAGNLTVEKSSDPASGSEVAPGSDINYTVTFKNTGGASSAVDYTDLLDEVLDDATLTAGPTSSDPSLVATLAGDGQSFSVVGSLAGGSTVTVTYTVKVNADSFGDGQLDNYVVKTGDNPPATCESDNPLCTEHPVPKDLTVTKTSDPVSGTQVDPGEVVKYTLTFANGGGAPADVDYTDYLAALLDDADITSDPVSSNSDLTVAPSPLGSASSFTVTGSVPGGTSYTVTYEATVKDSGFGDGQLDNFVRPTTDTPPTPGEECQSGDPLCTSHPVPGNLSVVKDSDPASGTEVSLGDLVSYTLTFTNTGAQASPVDYTDDLTKALDDATVEGQPTISGNAHGLSASSVSGGKFAVTGDLEAESTVQVKYSLRVKTSNLGDGSLDNFVVKTGDNPPSTCEDTNDLCTEHPVAGNLTVEKSSDPVSGTVLKTGDEVTYTLTFKNSGGGSSAVDYTDHLGKVLDDATVVSAPAFDGPAGGLSVTSVAGGKFTVSGDLAGGTTVKVVYTVKVKAAADRGDSLLDNFLVKGSGEPPATCEEDTPLCTEHPVGNFSVTKTSDPEAGTKVKDGDTVTYTLTFANTGATTHAVDYTDYLAKVLDDAILTKDPVIEGEAHGLSVSEVADKKFTVSGDLEARSTVRVTYSVKVHETGNGDLALTNFLVEGDDSPPSRCTSTTPLCTEHPVTVPKPDVEAGGGGILEGALPNTGGPVFALLLAGLLAALVGALMVGARRRREE